MDYTGYLLSIEFVILVGFIAIWWVKRRHNSMYPVRLELHRGRLQEIRRAKRKNPAEKPSRFRRGSKEAEPAEKANLRFKQAAMNVPIPWGWPHYQDPRGSRMEKPRISQSMAFLVDSLMREKQLTTSQSADPRILNSVRALIEDRYARVDKDQVNEVKYYKTKPPLVRDPSEPHDQMDNFGHREAERISDKLKPVSAVHALHRALENVGSSHPTDIGKIRRPWGW